MLADLIEADPPLTNAFAAELASRLQAQGSALAFAMSWLEQRLAESGQTVEHVFDLATQSQAADQVSIGNTIGSLRFLGATDWRDFVEATSVVEHTLRSDPSRLRDDGLRDARSLSPRRRVDRAAKHRVRGRRGAHCDPARSEASGRARHVGYFLIGTADAPSSALCTCVARTRRSCGTPAKRCATTCMAERSRP